MPSTRELARLYSEAHNTMRNVDGLQPQEAFDELLKYLFFKQNHELLKPNSPIPSPDQVRKLFSTYLGKSNSWSSEIWREKKFFLSDDCLSDLNNLLYPVSFSKIDYDVRSHALKEFLTPDIRKGLGIFLTPDEIVSAIVEFVPQKKTFKVLDPACGSGTFLIEYLKRLNSNKEVTINGADKSPRMLLLADLNLGHFPQVNFIKQLDDSIRNTDASSEFDLILTNPPFGVSMDSRDYDFSHYLCCQDENGYPVKKQTSEIVFIERCLQLIKPGGTIAIVIPKSIATNNGLQLARSSLSEYGYVYGVMSLPPETFSSTGTQTTTIVLFIKRYKSIKERKEPIKLALATISNVGFDTTGRYKEGNQLPSFSENMASAIATGKNNELVELLDYKSKEDVFKNLSEIFIPKIKNAGDLTLDQVTSFIGTGRTPARKDYAEEGDFLIKVGNLTGTGINWDARDRNYMNELESSKRKKSTKALILKKGDILLTSSAHSPVYIAKKSDIYDGQPDFMTSNTISYVGEVMMIRVDSEKIDPYLLLAFLRAKSTVNTIQKMVRGQTAHLHSRDLSQLILPKELFSKNSKYTKVAEILKEQRKLSEKMNSLVAQQSALLD